MQQLRIIASELKGLEWQIATTSLDSATQAGIEATQKVDRARARAGGR